MKILVDGKEMEADTIKVMYEDQWLGVDDETNEEVTGQLHLTLTNEGMIADTFPDREDLEDETTTGCWELQDIVDKCF